MKQMLLKNGNLYLDSELYETYFSTINSVVLIKKDDTFLLMPVQKAGGGLLFKIRNTKGDRIVHAIEFFQQSGIESEEEKVLDVEWSAELAALTFTFN